MLTFQMTLAAAPPKVESVPHRCIYVVWAPIFEEVLAYSVIVFDYDLKWLMLSTPGV
jgi:hypothetical protein